MVMDNIKIVIIYSHDDEIKFFLNKYSTTAKIISCSFNSLLIHKIESSLIIKSGIGIVNAAAAITYVLCKFKPEQIINIGFAGASSKNNIKLLEMYRITKCYYNDFDLRIFNYEYGTTVHNENNYPLITSNLPTWINKIKPQKLVSCNKFIVNKSDLLNPHIIHKKILVDMEGAAMTEIAKRFNFKKLILLKIVTDFINDNNIKSQNWSSYTPEICNLAAFKICTFIEKILKYKSLVIAKKI